MRRYRGQVHRVKDQAPIDLDSAGLNKLSKTELIELLAEKEQALQDKDRQIIELTEQLARLNQQQDEQKQQAINKMVNQPTSKKPEWIRMATQAGTNEKAKRQKARLWQSKERQRSR